MYEIMYNKYTPLPLTELQLYPRLRCPATFLYQKLRMYKVSFEFVYQIQIISNCARGTGLLENADTDAGQ